MIRKAQEYTPDYRENMRGGDGVVELTNFVTPEDLNNKGRLFGKIKLNPGCGIGYHVHEADAEIFCIISGTAEYSDNGEIKTVSEGDVMICPTGTGHSICNKTDSPVELIAVIVNA